MTEIDNDLERAWERLDGGKDNLTGKYILEGRTPVPCPNLVKWGEWFQNANRHVARTEFQFEDNDLEGVTVSTVFLGLDHRFSGTGLPVLFETMIFGGKLNEEMHRYCTWDQALEGHERTVDEVLLAELAHANNSQNFSITRTYNPCADRAEEDDRRGSERGEEGAGREVELLKKPHRVT